MVAWSSDLSPASPLLVRDVVCHVHEEVWLDFWADPASPVFAGHFPDAPVLPGAFLVDAALQAVAIGMGGAFERGDFELSQMRLQRPIRPGDRGLLRATAMGPATDRRGPWRIAVSTGDAQVARFQIAATTALLPGHAIAPEAPATAALERDGICRLLPHRPPMQLIDRAWHRADGSVLGVHQVGAAECDGMGRGALGAPFAIDGFLQTGGLLLEEATAHQVLLFGGLRRARLADLPSKGTMLVHHLRPQRRSTSAVLLDGETWAEGQLLAAYEGVTLAARPPEIAASDPAPSAAPSTVVSIDGAPIGALA